MLYSLAFWVGAASGGAAIWFLPKIKDFAVGYWSKLVAAIKAKL